MRTFREELAALDWQGCGGWGCSNNMADLFEEVVTIVAAAIAAGVTLAHTPPEPVDLRSEAALDAFIAGIDSPWHSDESRRGWCRLFLRDAAMGVLRLPDPRPAPDAALPLGEPAMHAHDGIGLHRAEAHHRPADYQVTRDVSRGGHGPVTP